MTTFECIVHFETEGVIAEGYAGIRRNAITNAISNATKKGRVSVARDNRAWELATAILAKPYKAAVCVAQDNISICVERMEPLPYEPTSVIEPPTPRSIKLQP